jgi:hypothetical protein
MTWWLVKPVRFWSRAATVSLIIFLTIVKCAIHASENHFNIPLFKKSRLFRPKTIDATMRKKKLLNWDNIFVSLRSSELQDFESAGHSPSKTTCSLENSKNSILHGLSSPNPNFSEFAFLVSEFTDQELRIKSFKQLMSSSALDAWAEAWRHR